MFVCFACHVCMQSNGWLCGCRHPLGVKTCRRLFTLGVNSYRRFFAHWVLTECAAAGATANDGGRHSLNEDGDREPHCRGEWSRVEWSGVEWSRVE